MKNQQDHRNWPAPDKPWRMKQIWHDLLFAHWPMPSDLLAAHLPKTLTLDRYQGQAWIGVVPFWMSDIRLQGMPTIPFISRFAELNVRTYVTAGDKPGVYFFSLDAASFLAVYGARWGFSLPYYWAQMKVTWDKEMLHFASLRRGRRAHPAIFAADYKPISEPFEAQIGSLEDWLTARYCLYTERFGVLHRCEIDHLPWSLQEAEADIKMNKMLEPLAMHLPKQAPLLYYSKRLEVNIWSLEKVMDQK